MISRRNYFAITIVMLVIVFMFMSAGVMTEIWNDYETNSYEEEREKLPGRNRAYAADGAGEEGWTDGARDFIVFVGGEELEASVRVWASYTKKNMEGYASLERCREAEWREGGRIPDMLILDSAGIQWEEEEEAEELLGYLEAGCDLIFCNMPDPSVLEKNEEIRKLFGVRRVKEEAVSIDGVHLYAGFLLGGEAVYQASDAEERRKRQDLDLVIPWYELDTDTDVYMKGILAGGDIDSEEYPVILWKKNAPDACVMVLNGSYMEEFGGIGLLSAMSAQIRQYVLYPVVNAQNLTVANYPVLASENEGQLMRIYSRDMQGVGRDILWPGIMTAYRQTRMGLTCMLSPQLDYEDGSLPEGKQLHYYLKNLNKEKGETGLSGVCRSAASLEEKLAEDFDFMEEALPGYRFSSFYAGGMGEEEAAAVLDERGMSSIRTVVMRDGEGDEIVGYLSEHVTRQEAVSEGFSHTYRDDLRFRCVETMLGYTNILLDVEDAVYPDGEEDGWETLSEDLSWNLKLCERASQGFEGTTVSESDLRIRRFLQLDYSQQREGADISLHLRNVQEPVWFILRTHNEEIARMEGGSFTQLEEGAYLLELTESETVITMKSTEYRH